MKLAHVWLRAQHPPAPAPPPEPPVPTEPPPPRPAPILIIADTYRDAGRFARDHDLGPEGPGWRFAYNVHHAQGMDPGRYITLTTGGVTGRELQARIELGQYLRALGWTYGLDGTGP